MLGNWVNNLQNQFLKWSNVLLLRLSKNRLQLVTQNYPQSADRSTDRNENKEKMYVVDRMSTGAGEARILKSGIAQRIVFFYPGEEGTYVEHVFTTLFDNGIVQLKTGSEETTTHLRNCEILWSFQAEEERTAKIRLLKSKPSTAAPKIAPSSEASVLPEIEPEIRLESRPAIQNKEIETDLNPELSTEKNHPAPVKVPLLETE